MNMPNPKDDHPVVQDARRILHLTQCINLFDAGCPDKEVHTLKTLLSEASEYIDSIQIHLKKRGCK